MTHRITPYPHELRRFQEAGSVLIVREPEQEIQVYEDQVSYGGVLLPTMADLIGAYCPFPSAGEEVWFAEEFAHDIGLWFTVAGRKTWDNQAIYYKLDKTVATFDQQNNLIEPPQTEGFDEAVVQVICDGWDDASEMPEWAARLRGVVVSRECRRLDQATQRLVTERDGCGLRSRHKLRYHWAKNSKTTFGADPWAWVVRIEKR